MNEARLQVTRARLDPDNPRLPENVVGASQPNILRFMYENGVLQELARSYIDNGFFEHEHLIVEDTPDGAVVLEGNRRLAALKVLLQDDDAKAAEVRFDLDLENELSDEARKKLAEVPAYFVKDRDEVRKYLGFRHIGGIKTWSAEAKARYIADEVLRASGEPNPFLDVARRVGSNAQGVRNSYIAIAVLRYASAELGIDVAAVQHNRFGVWMRALNAPDLRSYIMLGDPRTLDEVNGSLRALDTDHLREVLSDLVPQGGSKRPLLADSRYVTVYAQALAVPEARQAIRDYGDFDLARQIVERANLPERLDGLRRALQVILNEVTQVLVLEASVAQSAHELAQTAAGVDAVVRSKSP